MDDYPTWTSQPVTGVKLMVSQCKVNEFGRAPSDLLIHTGS